MARTKTPGPSRKAAGRTGEPFEAEVLPGLLPFAAAELGRLQGADALLASGDEAMRFDYRGDWRGLRTLRTAVAVYALCRFEVPRPKALLGNQHLRTLLDLVRRVLRYDPAQPFDGFRFGAAGSGSAVFERLAAEIEATTGVRYDPQDGELLLRVRPGAGAWEVLARLTPRPLSARAWRRCNMAGGLNATVAAAMLELAGIRPRDRVLNAMCGSGTLLVERGLMAPARLLAGADIDPRALACARENVAAAGLAGDVELLEGDATSLPFAPDSFELIVADVPWGDATGSVAANARLYPEFLCEAARLAVPGGRLVVLCHAMRQFEAVLAAQEKWRVKDSFQVYHGGHYPKMYLLTRRGRGQRMPK